MWPLTTLQNPARYVNTFRALALCPLTAGTQLWFLTVNHLGRKGNQSGQRKRTRPGTHSHEKFADTHSSLMNLKRKIFSLSDLSMYIFI